MGIDTGRIAEAGWIPDPGLRWGIRRLAQKRLAEQRGRASTPYREWLGQLRSSPIALSPELANAQHYEVPSAFFDRVLGPHRKYSCAWWDPGTATLADAEQAMLEKTAARAGLADGASILDLGCGWGSFTLWAAERFPRSRVVGVSNAKNQRESILRCARIRGLPNVEVITADINHFEATRRFDRVVSIEMFEHLRNWERALARVRHWLEPEGRVFLHYFCHREHAYPYEDRGHADWMARHFFSGGMMPAERMIHDLSGPFEVEASWRVPGTHYQQTSNAWLENLDREREAVLEIFRECYGEGEAERWFRRWRLFFLACAELFGYRDGDEWGVAHVRLAPGSAS